MKNQNKLFLALFFLINIIFSIIDQGTLIPYIIILQLPFLFILFVKKEVFFLPLMQPRLIIGIAFIINLIFSVNKQFTVERIFIWISVYLIFNIIYNLDLKENHKKMFINLLIYISLFLVPIFLYFRLNHKVTQATALSLIKPMTGHVHIASFFLIAFTASFLTKKFIPALLLLTTLVTTCSVSAFTALFLGILALNFIPNNLAETKNKKILLAVATLSLVLMLTLTYQTPQWIKNIDPLWSKKTLGGSRFRYWRQAVQGFSKKPITGWGLDTFGIVSTKFKHDNYYSLYPHGFPFKVLAETGIIGSIAFLYLVIKIIKNIALETKSEKIITGIIIISSLESLFDYSWQFPSILLILAACLAMIIKPVKKIKTKRDKLIIICLISAIISANVVGATYLKRSRKYHSAWVLYPFDSEIYLENYEKIPKRLINFMFGQDPNFWAKLSYRYNQNNQPQKEIIALKKELALLSPKGSIEKYLHLAEKLGDNDEQVVTLIKEAGTKYRFNLLPKIDNPTLEKVIIKTAREKLVQEKNYPKIFFPRLAYNLGLYFVENNQPETAKEYWQKAIEIEPEWSYFHIDLANLYWFLGEKDKAIKQLEEICQKYYFPKEHCSIYLKRHKQKFDSPGSMKKFVDKKFRPK